MTCRKAILPKENPALWRPAGLPGAASGRATGLRSDKRLTNRLAASKLRFPDACIENIDFASHRGLDRRNTLSLA
jgi:hypothetical protein